MSYNKLQALRDNVAAIKTAWDVCSNNRNATADEVAVLQKYTGFGGIKEVLMINDYADIHGTCVDSEAKFEDMLDYNYNIGKESKRQWLFAFQDLYKTLCAISGLSSLVWNSKGVCNDPLEEKASLSRFDMLTDSIKSSVLTAFYTPSPIVKAVADAVQHTLGVYGIKAQSMIETSAGIGGFLPVAGVGCKTVAFEKDIVSAMVLAALHPETDVYQSGFEKIDELLGGKQQFDIAASNIPFGNNIEVYDKAFEKGDDTHRRSQQAIHRYFFIKGMEQLADGGILAFITSRGVADADANEYIREWMVQNGNLLAAVRLPDNIFVEGSGVEVGSDLLIFQRDRNKTLMNEEEKMFRNSIDKEMAGEVVTGINRLLCLPKYAIYTDFSVKKNQYGKMYPKYRWSKSIEELGTELGTRLRREMERKFCRSAWYYGHDTLRARMEEAQRKASERKESRKERREDIAKRKAEIKPMYFDLMDAYYNLRSAERTAQQPNDELRRKLNEAYDTLVNRFGSLHDCESLIDSNSDYKNALALEIRNMDRKTYSKADIFYRPIDFRQWKEGETVEPAEALAMCMNELGHVDMVYMTKWTGITDDLYGQLKGEIFLVPVANEPKAEWQYKTQLLNGNVVKKRKDIDAWIAKYGKATDHIGAHVIDYINDSKQALMLATPATIPFDDIEIQLGARWVPSEYVERWLSWLTDVPLAQCHLKRNEETDTYIIEVNGWTEKLYDLRFSQSHKAEQVLTYAFNNNTPQLTVKIGDYTRPDREGMKRMQKMVDKIRKTWLDFVALHLTDDDKKRLETMYNELYNCSIRAKFDGSLQTFPGLCFDNLGFCDLYQSQKDAIWQCKMNNGIVCWHEVGAGKTMIMVVASYEMKRTGMIRKPLIIGLKSNVQQIAETYRKAYPQARILYPGKEDFTEDNRIEFFNKIANNDWDVIIMTHDQFVRIPQDPEIELEMCRDEENDLMEAIEMVGGYNENEKRARKSLQKSLDNLRTRMEKLNDRVNDHKDDVLTFHQMGIDHIFVDEYHQFKNLHFVTKHSRVGGLGNSAGSQRSWILLTAIRDMQRQRGTDMCASFFSGTIVVNALTELYNLFKYLRPSALEEQHIHCFDAWAAQYCNKSTDYDLTITGDVQAKERFRTYCNVPELSQFLREITDFRTAKMINLDRPSANLIFDTCDPSPIQIQMLEALKSYAEGGRWDTSLLGDAPKSDGKKNDGRMLHVTNTSIKVSLDVRLLNNSLPDNPDSKASRCARNVAEYYRKFDANKGVQFIFCDKSVYDKSKWNLYSDIYSKLVDIHGIPSEEIAFIHQWDTELKRKKLYAKLNAGEIRVVFGSTSKLGTGVNAQQRAVAVHHMDIPWRPADLEQRNGRAVRKGNEVKLWGDNQVDIITYGTNRTLDQYKFHLLSCKQNFITQINSENIGSRRMDEDSVTEEEGMTFAEYTALLSGNQDLLKLAKLEKKISVIEEDHVSFERNQKNAQRELDETRERIERFRGHIARYDSDLAYLTSAKGGLVVQDAKGDTIEDLGRALHAHRDLDHNAVSKQVGTYMGMPIEMTSIKASSGQYDHNEFCVVSPSGIHYRMSDNGTLGQSFADAVAYFGRLQDTIEHHKQVGFNNISNYEQKAATCEAQIKKVWDGFEELTTLKAEYESIKAGVDAELEAIQDAKDKALSDLADKDSKSNNRSRR